MKVKDTIIQVISDEQYIYGLSEFGRLYRLDTTTGEWVFILKSPRTEDIPDAIQPKALTGKVKIKL